MHEAIIAIMSIIKAMHGSINAATNCNTTSLNATKSKMMAKKMEAIAKAKLTIVKTFVKDLVFSFSILEFEVTVRTMNTSDLGAITPLITFHEVSKDTDCPTIIDGS